MKLFLQFRVVLVFAVLSLTACTMVHKGQIVSLDYGQAVSPQNQAIGIASAYYFLGLGGAGTVTLLKKAKDDLIRNRPLKEGEKYVNVNLNSSTFFFLFFTRHRYAITADVFSPNTSNLTIADSSKNETINSLPPVISFFEKGDSLFSTYGYEGTYISIASKNRIKCTNQKGKTEYYYEDKVFKKIDTYNGYKLGQVIKVTNTYPKTAQIIGFGLTKVLLINSENTMISMRYDNINE
jgi:hypothetical protein